jgi:beta-N-acetylglucosaminidase-like protein/glycosyl hydrolase family 20/cellulose/xylan binding protein with CBM9 domain
MNKVAKFLVLGIVLSSFSPIMGQSVNLAPNPGFEKAVDKKIPNWGIGKRILIPTPWKSKFKNNKIKVANVLLKTIPEDKIVNLAVEKLLNEQNIVVRQENAVEIICADKTNKETDQLFKKEFPDNSWDDIGTQGYFLNVGNNKIILAANTEQGRFYAMQTLRQLLKNGGGNEVEAVSIIDKPTVDRRGVVIGLQWFQEKEEAIRRMSRLKMNLVWHQGSFLNLKLGCSHKTLKTHWREPFTKHERKTIENYLKLCRENFIEVCVAFSPRGLPQTHYSSDKDIDLLVAKMETLYQGGVRGLGIAFDDLQNIEQDKLFYKDDIDKFDNNLGQAHAYFVDRVFKKLKEKCPEVNFAVLPYAYSGVTKLPEEGKRSKKYLQFLSKISPEIKRWVVCLYSPEDVMGSKKLSARKPFIWDNFYTTGRLAAFPAPIKRPGSFSNQNISGYMFLPATPSQEDAAKISWLNAADYEWAPARYKPEESYRRAIAFIANGEKATKLLQRYSSFSLKIDDYNFPTKNKETRLEFLNKTLAELDTFPEQLKILQPKLTESLNKDIVKYQKNLRRVVKNLKIRPFPALISKKNNQKTVNSNKLNNFIPLKKGKLLADSTAEISYDNENLYVKVHCNEPETNKIVAKRKERDANIFQDDSIELFIMPEPEDSIGNSTYYQIVVNSIGTVYDAKYIHKRFNYIHDQFKDWTANLKIKTKVNEDSWTLDVAIPFKDLGMKPPEKGKRIFVNICRNRYVGKKAEYSCYALLLKGKFHDPLSFWPMEFSD